MPTSVLNLNFDRAIKAPVFPADTTACTFLFLSQSNAFPMLVFLLFLRTVDGLSSGETVKSVPIISEDFCKITNLFKTLLMSLWSPKKI